MTLFLILLSVGLKIQNVFCCGERKSRNNAWLFLEFPKGTRKTLVKLKKVGSRNKLITQRSLNGTFSVFV